MMSRLSLVRRNCAAACLSAALLACSGSKAATPTSNAGDGRPPTDLAALQHYLAADAILVSLPQPSLLGVEQIVAFEDHEYFAYILGAAHLGDRQSDDSTVFSKPAFLRRVYYLRPQLMVIDDQLSTRHAGALADQAADEIRLDEDGIHFRGKVLLSQIGRASREGRPQSSEWKHSLKMVAFAKDREPAVPTASVERLNDTLFLELVENSGERAGRNVRLWLPDGSAAGRIAIAESGGKTPLLANRLLPAGILSPDAGAAKRRLQWDLPYQTGEYAVWDTGHASMELKRLVESGTIKPARAVDIGCGTGNDAVYLARRGFDVTAIDIAPTALSIAERQAEKAGVKVTWLLGDVLNPPLVEPFDFVFDRGCYHELRQHHAPEYVAAIKKLTRAGSKIVILAGSANKDTYWRFEGPPRVREQDIRNDFANGFRLVELREFRFDPAPREKQGALAWSILLTRSK